jgi:alkylation response protein AidB-like acyl-CoA dehydrogenase
MSAFALTEPLTGSDAANVRTEAVLDASGTLSFPSKPSPASKK